MSTPTLHGNGNQPVTMASPSLPTGFTPSQKEYLAGFMAGVTQRGFVPFAGHTAGGAITSTPAPSVENLAAPAAEPEQTVFGTPVSELNKQELWKLERHGLDIWDRLLEHEQKDQLPDEKDTYFFRFHGLCYVGPVQESLMLRCRIPAGEVSAAQLDGLADIAQNYGPGHADLTTRSNFQVREIAPRDLVKTLMRLQEIGLSSKGTGVDNIRNITVTPTAGVDFDEVLDTRPLAHGLSHCPNSCAQHYMGDIGLLGTRVGSDKREGYHVFVGGGFGEMQAVGREAFRGVAFESLKPTVEKMLRGYLRRREGRETFQAFAQRHDLKTLQEIFSNGE